MNSKKNTVVFVPGQIAENKETMDLITKELQNRGVDDIYALTQNDIGIHTSAHEQALAIIKILEEKNCIPPQQPEPEVYSQEDEEKIKKRLEDLGYL